MPLNANATKKTTPSRMRGQAKQLGCEGRRLAAAR